jgi:hypothetical protein
MTREPIKSPVVLRLKHPSRECSNPPSDDIEWSVRDKKSGAYLMAVTARRWIAARDIAVLELHVMGKEYEPGQLDVVPA